MIKRNVGLKWKTLNNKESEKRDENFRRSWENYSILNFIKTTVWPKVTCLHMYAS